MQGENLMCQPHIGRRPKKMICTDLVSTWFLCCSHVWRDVTTATIALLSRALAMFGSFCVRNSLGNHVTLPVTATAGTWRGRHRVIKWGFSLFLFQQHQYSIAGLLKNILYNIMHTIDVMSILLCIRTHIYLHDNL